MNRSVKRRNNLGHSSGLKRLLVITAPYFSACYAAPYLMANISSDPSNPLAEKWWVEKLAEIHTQMPTFGGFVVKADSEGNQGPQAFNKTEADGANLLARALKTVDGIVMWRGEFTDKPAACDQWACFERFISFWL